MMLRATASAALLLGVVAAAGCRTAPAAGEPVLIPEDRMSCAAQRDRCTELCHPRGVRHFACTPESGDEAFACECLDGTEPLRSEDNR